MKDGNNSGKDELTQRLEEELKKRGIARKYLTDEEVKRIIQKGKKEIEDIFQQMVENVAQRVDSVKSIGKTDSKKISRELRTSVKERIIRGTSFEDLAKDKDLKITEAQMKRLKKEFAVIFLLVQGMPKMDIARKVLPQEKGEDEQTYNLRLEQATKTYRVAESINKITAIRKRKEEEIKSRLKRGETVEEIVADKELNVCEELVRQVISEIEKRREKEEAVEKKREEAEAKRVAKKEAKAKMEAEAVAKREARAKRKAEVAAKKETKAKRKPEAAAKKEAAAKRKEGEAQKAAEAKRKAEAAQKQAEYKRRAEKGAIKRQGEKLSLQESSPIGVMRTKYKARYEGTTEKDSTQKTNQNIKMVDDYIDSIEERLKKAEEMHFQGKEVINFINQINERLRIGYNYSFTLEQALRLKKLFDFNFLNEIANKHKFYKAAIARMKGTANKKLEISARAELIEINDIELLERLRDSFPKDDSELLGRSEGIRTSIEKRISSVQMAEKAKKAEMQISKEMQFILRGISTGDLDVSMAKKLIEELATRKTNKATGRFALTQQDQERRIVTMIRQILINQFDRYPIQDMTYAMNCLENLSNGETTVNLNAVIENSLGGKRYEEAKRFCDGYIKEIEDINVRKNIYTLKRKITTHEIGNLVSIALASEFTEEQERAIWSTLKNRIRQGNLSLASIVIGKSKDGKRTITMQDIWPEKELSLN